MPLSIASSTLIGIRGAPVEVEVDVATGIPAVRIVGLPDAAVGVGGHIGAADPGIAAARARDWNEEVATPALPRFTPLGLLNDDGDDVGRVHLGVVYLALLTSPEIQVREREKLAGALVPLEEAVARADELEGWSAALISHIEALAT